jgi:hypothetical protein
MARSGEFWIFYPKESGFGLKAATAALEGARFATRAKKKAVEIKRKDLTFEMTVCADDTSAELRAVASSKAGPKHRRALSRCDGAIQVSVGDLEAALDEINGLIEMQLVLQDACKGFLFVGWNCKFQAPVS